MPVPRLLVQLSPKKRGFTMTELAIVISIIGLIIGTTFAVARSVHFQFNTNKSSDELGLIALNMRSLYTSRSTSYAALLPPAAPNFSTTPQYLGQSVVPGDMWGNASGACAGIVANTAWNLGYSDCSTGTALGSVQLSLTGSAGNPVQFVIRYTQVPGDACSDMLTRNSLPGPTTGLTKIIVTPGATYTDAANQLPVTSAVAATACTSGSLYTIDWYYNLSL